MVFSDRNFAYWNYNFYSAFEKYAFSDKIINTEKETIAKYQTEIADLKEQVEAEKKRAENYKRKSLIVMLKDSENKKQKRASDTSNQDPQEMPNKISRTE